MITYCFTGHRPDKLGGYNWNSPKNIKIMNKLESIIIQLIESSKDNNLTFIVGGALGIDTMSFFICEKLKKIYTKKNIKIILAMPFEKQDNNWFNQIDKDRLKYQRQNADEVVLVDTLEKYKFNKVSIGDYHPAKMQLRNMYMVDISNGVIGVWDGSKGGTGNCVNYAKKQGKELIIIDPKNL
jgi:uncharacterized phage-like protein YoqJ